MTYSFHLNFDSSAIRIGQQLPGALASQLTDCGGSSISSTKEKMDM